MDISDLIMESNQEKCINEITKRKLLLYSATMPPTQAESVIKNIIREIGQECAAHGEITSETVVAFMVRLITLVSPVVNKF